MPAKNPPAFPHTHLGIHRGELSYEDTDYEDGMSLRDYFAAKIAASLAGAQWFTGPDEKLARRSYEMADALLSQRCKL